jgi:hypothetical protein
MRHTAPQSSIIVSFVKSTDSALTGPTTVCTNCKRSFDLWDAPPHFAAAIDELGRGVLNQTVSKKNGRKHCDNNALLRSHTTKRVGRGETKLSEGLSEGLILGPLVPCMPNFGAGRGRQTSCIFLAKLLWGKFPPLKPKRGSMLASNTDRTHGRGFMPLSSEWPELLLTAHPRNRFSSDLIFYRSKSCDVVRNRQK